MREELSGLKDAFANVKMKGYGVVTPSKEDIRLEDPVIIKQGSKFGVKIRSEAPSIHMIRANIETEIAPIVGSEKQAEDLAEYIKKESETPQGVWGTNIFGKTVEELVMDGMRNKIAMINDESQVKLQDSMQKIVNDTNGGLVCIMLCSRSCYDEKNPAFLTYKKTGHHRVTTSLRLFLAEKTSVSALSALLRCKGRTLRSLAMSTLRLSCGRLHAMHAAAVDEILSNLQGGSLS